MCSGRLLTLHLSFRIMLMYFDGIIIGAAAFIIIGLFHPIVIKGEYYFGTSLWPIFAIAGAVFVAGALFLDSIIVRSIMGITGFTLWWSILELFHQSERVRKGWFPKNPRRNS